MRRDIFFLDLTDFLLYRRATMIPCKVVTLVAEFVCVEMQGTGFEALPSVLGEVSGRFIETQIPSLIKAHYITKEQSADLIRLAERIGKGFALVLLEEKGG